MLNILKACRDYVTATFSCSKIKVKMCTSKKIPRTAIPNKLDTIFLVVHVLSFLNPLKEMVKHETGNKVPTKGANNKES